MHVLFLFLCPEELFFPVLLTFKVNGVKRVIVGIYICGCEKSSGPIEKFMGKRSWDLEQNTKSIF